MGNFKSIKNQNQFNDNDKINFECITDFLICCKKLNFNYIKPDKAGKKEKIMTEISEKGKNAVIEFEKYANLLLGQIKDKDYVYEKCSSWQNSGNLAKYLWIEFKKKGKEKYPHSISVAIYLDNGSNKNHEVLLGFNIEAKDNRCTSIDYEYHNKILEVPIVRESNLYYRANTFSNKNIEYYDIKDLKNDLDSNSIKKLLIGKIVEGPYINENAERIVHESISVIEELRPFYEHIISEREKAEIDINYINNNIPKKNEEKDFGMRNLDIGLNTILFGPPGTGKTYNAINYAVAICSDNEDLNSIKAKNYKEVLIEYEKLKSEGRIIFTTFHQSYGYEEFIEGIYPIIDTQNEESDLKYIIKSGIFKSLCESADKSIIDNNKFNIRNDASVWKVTIRNSVADDCFNNNRVRINFEFDDEGADGFINQIKIGDIILTTNGSRRNINGIAVVNDNACNLKKAFSDKVSRGVEWIIKNIDEDIFSLNEQKLMQRNTVAKLSRVKIDKLLDFIISKSNIGRGFQVENYKPYVIIIDEINRGNISKIFGELITLIEDTKRKGMDEEASSILPYSRKEFSVPSNIYIIGTMNTADRSIALMDTALRRRFNFVEMMPDVDVLKNISTENLDGLDIVEMLNKINERITFLYDREHTIGHAFFMKLKNSADINTLGNIFKTSVIPLLQEYFYEDYHKIQLVLGDNAKVDSSTKFILDEKLEINDIIKGNTDDDIDLPEKKYRINNEAFYNIESYKHII